LDPIQIYTSFSPIFTRLNGKNSALMRLVVGYK